MRRILITVKGMFRCDLPPVVTISLFLLSRAASVMVLWGKQSKNTDDPENICWTRCGLPLSLPRLHNRKMLQAGFGKSCRCFCVSVVQLTDALD